MVSRVGNANRYAKVRKDREAKRDADILRLVTECGAVAVVGSPLYMVTPRGHVYSTFWRTVKRINPGVKPGGYEFVGIYENGTPKYRMVHRIVAEAFIENPLGLPEVNHKDGNKRNNAAENLEWVTRKENVAHAFRSGLGRKGPNHPSSKLSHAHVAAIRAATGCYRAIGRRFGVCAQTVLNVKHRRTYRDTPDMQSQEL